MYGDVTGGAKVFWTEPDHDEKVKDWIRVAMAQAEREMLVAPRGCGVIDFADCTVIVLSAAIPFGEVFEVSRRSENSILHGGFGAAPHRSASKEDFTTGLKEIKNPDARSTSIGVTGLRKD